MDEKQPGPPPKTGRHPTGLETQKIIKKETRMMIKAAIVVFLIGAIFLVIINTEVVTCSNSYSGHCCGCCSE